MLFYLSCNVVMNFLPFRVEGNTILMGSELRTGIQILGILTSGHSTSLAVALLSSTHFSVSCVLLDLIVQFLTFLIFSQMPIALFELIRQLALYP